MARGRSSRTRGLRLAGVSICGVCLTNTINRFESFFTIPPNLSRLSNSRFASPEIASNPRKCHHTLWSYYIWIAAKFAVPLCGSLLPGSAPVGVRVAPTWVSQYLGGIQSLRQRISIAIRVQFIHPCCCQYE